MSRQLVRSSVVLCLLWLGLGCAPEHEFWGDPGSRSRLGKVTPDLASVQADFVDRQCLACHRDATAKNRFVDLRDLNWIIEGSGTAPPRPGRGNLIKPGCPKESFFMTVIRSGEMPPRPAKPVDPEVVAVLESWILGLDPSRQGRCDDEPGD